MLAHSFGDSSSYQAGLYLVGQKRLALAPVAMKYEILRALYEQNNLYEDVGRFLRSTDTWTADIKALATCVNEVVEFYAENLLVGELALETENEAILEPIDRFWRWSNFDAQKLVLSREVAMLGDSFLQVTMRPDRSRVFMELLDPAHMVDFDVDERGFVVWARLEVPMQRRLPNGTTEPYTEVIIWSKAEQSYRRWEYRDRERPLNTVDDDIARLGTPVEDLPFAAFGIDFVPIVHIPFRRVPGDKRGQAAVWPSIEKIVELDLSTTALHQSSFAYDRPTWAIESDGRDPNNRPIPPPSVGTTTNAAGDDTVPMGRESLFRLPAGWHLKSTVPDINFEAELRIAQDYRAILERERPELLYGRLADLGGTISGRALRFMLTKAIKACLEARANVEQGLVAANQMALTLMQVAGLAERSIGAFTNTTPATNFDHRFAARDVLPADGLEDAQEDLAKAQAFAAWVQGGLPFGEALLRSGYTAEKAAELMAAHADALAGAGPTGAQ